MSAPWNLGDPNTDLQIADLGPTIETLSADYRHPSKKLLGKVCGKTQQGAGLRNEELRVRASLKPTSIDAISSWL
jgi:hypothetical protein